MAFLGVGMNMWVVYVLIGSCDLLIGGPLLLESLPPET